MEGQRGGRREGRKGEEEGEGTGVEVKDLRQEQRAGADARGQGGGWW
jgi:hypothetical protein